MNIKVETKCRKCGVDVIETFKTVAEAHAFTADAPILCAEHREERRRKKARKVKR